MPAGANEADEIDYPVQVPWIASRSEVILSRVFPQGIPRRRLKRGAPGFRRGEESQRAEAVHGRRHAGTSNLREDLCRAGPGTGRSPNRHCPGKGSLASARPYLGRWWIRGEMRGAGQARNRHHAGDRETPRRRRPPPVGGRRSESISRAGGFRRPSLALGGGTNLRLARALPAPRQGLRGQAWKQLGLDLYRLHTPACPALRITGCIGLILQTPSWPGTLGQGLESRRLLPPRRPCATCCPTCR